MLDVMKQLDGFMDADCDELINRDDPAVEALFQDAKHAIRLLTNESQLGYDDHRAKANGRYLAQEYPGHFEHEYVSRMFGWCWTLTGYPTWGELISLIEEAYALYEYGDTGNWHETWHEVVEEARDNALARMYGKDKVYAVNVWEYETGNYFDYELTEYGYYFTNKSQLHEMEGALGLTRIED